MKFDPITKEEIEKARENPIEVEAHDSWDGFVFQMLALDYPDIFGAPEFQGKYIQTYKKPIGFSELVELKQEMETTLKTIILTRLQEAEGRLLNNTDSIVAAIRRKMGETTQSDDIEYRRGLMDRFRNHLGLEPLSQREVLKKPYRHTGWARLPDEPSPPEDRERGV